MACTICIGLTAIENFCLIYNVFGIADKVLKSPNNQLHNNLNNDDDEKS